MEAAAVVAEAGGNTARQLALDDGGVFEAVLPLEVRIGVARRPDAERVVVARPDLVVLRDVIPIEIVPRAAVAREKHRVVRVDVVGGELADVLADAALDCRLAVAEQVVRGAEAR